MSASALSFCLCQTVDWTRESQIDAVEMEMEMEMRPIN